MNPAEVTAIKAVRDGPQCGKSKRSALIPPGEQWQRANLACTKYFSAGKAEPARLIPPGEQWQRANLACTKYFSAGKAEPCGANPAGAGSAEMA